jgi:hypothetical protein
LVPVFWCTYTAHWLSCHTIDSSLFVYKHGANVAYHLLYIDNIILTASTLEFLHRVVDGLKGTFTMKDLDPLHYFLGIQIRCDRHCF